MTKRYVQIYTGDGKGKTTAAVGLTLRAVGAGWRVFIGQFVKGRLSHEMRLLEKLCPDAVRIEPFGHGTFIKDRPSHEDIAAARHGLERLKRILASGDFDLVIADEVGAAVSTGILGVFDLLEWLDARPRSIELVLTGRAFDPRILERADLVTEMRPVKHYFDAGVPARQGIEF